MKALLLTILISATAYAHYPSIREQARIDVEDLIRFATEGRLTSMDLSAPNRRLVIADITLPKLFADFAPEFRWNRAEERPGYTIEVSAGDHFKQRQDVTHSVLITTQRHLICIRLRYHIDKIYPAAKGETRDPRFSDQFQLLGYSVENRPNNPK